MSELNLTEKIGTRQAVVGVIGLGYVGLPILLEFAACGFPIRGFDTDAAKVDRLKNGKSYIRHIKDERIQAHISGNDLADMTTDFGRISECDAILICVPTPLTRNREPDLSYIRQTATDLGRHLRAGQLIVLESTTYPGTTEEELVPVLEEGSGLKAGTDFHVAYSPEREDPNNAEFNTKSITRLVGGIDADSARVACLLYRAVIDNVLEVSSCRLAEATKLVENIFRSVNIALVNELKMVFSEMDIDIWEVIEAARTKPFGYMPFYPGPGLGGHCIPIDPFYLSWKAREFETPCKFIELAGEINTSMPHYVIERTIEALNDMKKSLRGSRVLIVGVAYKPDVDDDRCSTSYVLWRELETRGAQVDYLDPYCPVLKTTREFPEYVGIESKTMEDLSRNTYDAAIIATAHGNIDHDAIAAKVGVIIDTRNVCKRTDNVYPA